MKPILLILIICLISIFSYGQTGTNTQWTWVSGDSTLNSKGIYGVEDTSGSNNIPGARYESLSWTDHFGNLWLFGGYGYDTDSTLGYLNDLWKYSPSTNLWTWVSGNRMVDSFGIYGTIGIPSSTNIPGAREGGVPWIDKAGNLWLFGGYGYDINGSLSYLSDLWEYSISTNQWASKNADTVGWNDNGGVNDAPMARSGAVSWSDNIGNFWLYGGTVTVPYDIGHTYNLNDLWKYNLSSNVWVLENAGGGAVSPPDGKAPTETTPIYGTLDTPGLSNSPGSRINSVSWIDSSGNLWLFGGIAVTQQYNGSPYPAWYIGDLNDLWEYNPSSNEWTWMNGMDSVFGGPNGTYGSQGIPASINTPTKRSESNSWKDNSGNFWLYSGDNLLGDLWEYNPSSNQWTWEIGDTTNGWSIHGAEDIPGNANTPGGRESSNTWTDGSGNLWLFGGSGYDANGNPGYFNDLWEISSNSILPLTLLYFTAKPVQTEVLVNWKTVQEINTASFEVQRSTDAITFSDLGSVSAAGKSSTIRNYSFTDPNPEMGNNYYRLKMIDLDGKFTFSKIVKINMNETSPLLLFPNPAKDILYFQSSGNNEEVVIEIFDALGRKRIEEKVTLNGKTIIPVNIQSLPEGIYEFDLLRSLNSEQVEFVKQ